MLDVLSRLLSDFVCFVRTALVTVANAFIEGLATLAQAGLDALPGMPAFPELPGATDWLTWIVPLSTIVSALAAMVTLLLTFTGIATALRWVKAL